jgi:hypothetical protein
MKDGEGIDFYIGGNFRIWMYIGMGMDHSLIG